MREKLNITAHSGCDGTERDSIESIAAGIHNGADAVEVDVRCNSRGELVLSHDQDESGVYSGKVFLSEAFKLVADNGSAGLNCDVKESKTVPAILALAEGMGFGPERLILTGSLNHATLLADPGITARASVWLNVEEIVEEYFRTGAAPMQPFRHLIADGARRHDTLEPLAARFESLLEPVIADCRRAGARALNVPFTPQLVPFIPHLTAAGLQVSAWTISNREPLERAFELGLLNVTTRNTRLAVEVRGL
jgi:glycerophosphoryl diester phosphodiesterase